MVKIRTYQEADAALVGRLIASTYAEFNLAFASPDHLKQLLGPFAYAESLEPAHQEAIARVLRSEMVYVAEDGQEIVGVLRGRSDCLASLFVRGDHHRQGIGKALVEHFEAECCRRGALTIRLAATVYAVPFYLKMGYVRSTGVRNGRSFEGRGLKIQPMKKVL